MKFFIRRFLEALRPITSKAKEVKVSIIVPLIRKFVTKFIVQPPQYTLLRYMAITIDIIIFSVLFSTLLKALSRLIFKMYFVDIENEEALMRIFATSHEIKHEYLVKLIFSSMVTLFIEYVILGAYIIGFNLYFSSTPGKYIFKLKIVDYNTEKKPSFMQFLRRYLGYLAFPISLCFVIFRKNSKFVHDIFGRTKIIRV